MMIQSMKSLSFSFGFVLFVLSATVTQAAPPKTTNAVASQEIIRSEFVIPKAQSEGRDPFFPNSTSLYNVAVPTNRGPVTVVASLTLMGLSPEVAVINGVSMKPGEETEVKVPGGRVSVRLLEIRVNDDLAVVEVNGARRELTKK
jgi:hypothetical protein